VDADLKDFFGSNGVSDHSEERGGAKRLAHLRARIAGHGERKHTKDEGKGGLEG